MQRGTTTMLQSSVNVKSFFLFSYYESWQKLTVEENWRVKLRWTNRCQEKKAVWHFLVGLMKFFFLFVSMKLFYKRLKVNKTGVNGRVLFFDRRRLHCPIENRPIRQSKQSCCFDKMFNWYLIRTGEKKNIFLSNFTRKALILTVNVINWQRSLVEFEWVLENFHRYG